MVKILNDKTNYWLVRTAGGAFYDQFVAGNYVGIGWNEISDLDSLIKVNKDESCSSDFLLYFKNLTRL